tara:strand:+ start:667 stop:1359 length:693 start_codon:yes stop_codon:yes gene_type:complete
MANFSGSFISNTYHRVLQLDTTLQDGTGSLIQSLPVTASNAISASYAISSSHEIIKEVSASIADTASFVEYSNVANKPTLLSSSAQIADDISGSFTSTSASFSTTITSNSSSVATDIAALELFSSSLDDTFATDAELNTATSSLSASLATDIATKADSASFSTDIASLVTDSGSFSTRITNLVDKTGSYAPTSSLGSYVSSSTVDFIQIITSASYASITPVSGTLYIIQG